MPSAGKLWVVATPIGNIGDLSPRACEVLASAYIVLAEDTRRAARLLHEAGLRHGALVSFYDHNEQTRIGQVLETLADGHHVALISDAGTPLLSDPGYRLVRECREQGIVVSAVPGPCAPVVALSAAGIAPLPFTFLGFLPRGKSDREAIFRLYGATPATLVFFERKDRAPETLVLAFDVLGERDVALCRELTKPYEEFIIGKLSDGERLATDLRGELTIVLGPPQVEARLAEAEVLPLLGEELSRGSGFKATARAVAKLAPGWRSKDLYDLLLRQYGEGRP